MTASTTPEDRAEAVDGAVAQHDCADRGCLPRF
jgi:hypothetical protein